MDLWPAIDIRQGRCVRLLRGDFSLETRFGDPELVAEEYVRAGAERLHVVDLDAALTGMPVNREVIAAVARRAGVPVQAGGGIRDEAAAEQLFGFGVARVVLGTAAIEDPELLVRLSQRWPGRVAAGLDYRRSRAGALDVAVRGWSRPAGRSIADILPALGELPLAGVVVTDIDRDGTGLGPDLAGLAEVLRVSELPVVSSGGVSGDSDLVHLARLEAGGRRLAGAIVGRALLSGQLDLGDALAACRSPAAHDPVTAQHLDTTEAFATNPSDTSEYLGMPDRHDHNDSSGGPGR
jgi:phosphoribosylformimino-5-aminoimidazole carboxamide ribotide isomerase